MTIIRDGSMALNMFSGRPVQPIMPNVQMMVKPAVTRGMTADSPLRIKNTMATTSSNADNGPSRIKS